MIHMAQCNHRGPCKTGRSEPLVGDVDNGKGYACVGTQDIRKIHVPSVLNLKFLKENKLYS